MRRRLQYFYVAAVASVVSACLTLDVFYFKPRAVDEYGWDDDPCDPELLGEIAEAEAVRGGPPASCHPSLIPAADRNEGFVEVNGRDVHYVYARRQGAVATIFYSHGRSFHLGRYWDRVELLWSQGYNVMTYDYPGFGRSGGSNISEKTIFDNARAVLEILPDQDGVDPNSIFFMGYSLGGVPTFAMTLEAVSGELDVYPAGVISESTFCSNEVLVQDGSYSNFPVEFFSDNPFDNCRRMDEVTTEDPALPIVLMHGTKDDFLLPVHADLLMERTNEGDVELTWVKGADHQDIPVVGGAIYLDLINDFVAAHIP